MHTYVLYLYWHYIATYVGAACEEVRMFNQISETNQDWCRQKAWLENVYKHICMYAIMLILRENSIKNFENPTTWKFESDICN